MGFKDSEITKCSQISLKGSAGIKKDVFLGYIDKNLFIQSENGKYYSRKQVFYVLRDGFDIPNILGQPFLTEAEVSLKYSKENLRVLAVLKNDAQEYDSIYLRIAKQKALDDTVNYCQIQPGDTAVTFYLENINVNKLGECSLKSYQLEFLPVDFGAFKDHLLTDQGVFSEQSDELITLPLREPAKC